LMALVATNVRVVASALGLVTPGSVISPSAVTWMALLATSVRPTQIISAVGLATAAFATAISLKSRKRKKKRKSEALVPQENRKRHLLFLMLFRETCNIHTPYMINHLRL